IRPDRASVQLGGRRPIHARQLCGGTDARRCRRTPPLEQGRLLRRPVRRLWREIDPKPSFPRKREPGFRGIDDSGPTMRLLIFGPGYTATRLAAALDPGAWSIATITRETFA